MHGLASEPPGLTKTLGVAAAAVVTAGAKKVARPATEATAASRNVLGAGGLGEGAKKIGHL
jgi:hypothetical protein